MNMPALASRDSLEQSPCVCPRALTQAYPPDPFTHDALAACPFPHASIGGALVFHGDMFDVMPWLLDNGLAHVDMVLTDPPYGITDCSWDVKINLPRYWQLMLAAARHNAAHCLFAQMPFAFELYASNAKMFRYDLVYKKRKAVGFLNARRMPLRNHELILLFYKKLPVYNPQLRPGKPYAALNMEDPSAWVYGARKRYRYANPGFRYPLSIIESGTGEERSSRRFHSRRRRGVSLDARQGGQALQGGIGLLRSMPPTQCAGQRSMAPGSPRGHSTQKNIHALAFLIRSYTNPGDLILDPLMGSGSAGAAALRSGRRFIGIEQEERFFQMACRRLELAHARGEDMIVDPLGYQGEGV